MEGAVADGVANPEINKLAGDAGISKGMDGIVDKEADQHIGGNAGTGGSSGFKQTAEDGMVNQEVNKVAGDVGVPGAADGMVDKEVDQEVNKIL